MADPRFSASLSEHQEELENRLLETGSPVGNGCARQQLGCSGEDYDAVKTACRSRCASV
ncbi:hypothetical protein [Candidatus Synechococcus spongiarum]|uniref:hypothetical protein n=1 Tax=Candidatus Synechococcus spongiarum TaxID=431041 RepID=UPI0015D66131|nr:hypothetical protein [Candidatus Synechococcus spongiarum]